jgi:integrase
MSGQSRENALLTPDIPGHRRTPETRKERPALDPLRGFSGDRRALYGREETLDTFATRWPDDYRRGKGGRLRSESTAEHNRERVRRFGQEHATRTLRSISRTDGRAWANDHPSTVAALRAMFSDAVEDNLADENPFARLGLATGRGRGDIIVLTRNEVHDLAEFARRHDGGPFGLEIQALILWGAYTCMRPGESFAARYSLLAADATTCGASSTRRSAVRPSPSTTARA